MPVDVDGDGVVDVATYGAGSWGAHLSGSGNDPNVKLARTFGLSSDQSARATWLTRGDDVRVVIESPAPGANKTQPFALTGWAIAYPAASGTGVDQVKVLAYPNPGSGLPAARPRHRQPGRRATQCRGCVPGQYTQNAGWTINSPGLPPNVYRFAVSAHVVADEHLDGAANGHRHGRSSAAAPLVRGRRQLQRPPQSVVVTNPQSGVDMHYTVSGAEPAQTDTAIASGGTILVNATQTLKVAA